ncbi:uncharacterized protein LOC134281079 [Saccostrea cucullata]|uniref:uncharacterized protein LOC134281079 n=1 Tax=Saccostrea cuccullata TaxID=36930 RepID=UPI002ED653B5
MSDDEPSTSKGRHTRQAHADDIMQLFASEDEGSFSGFELDKNLADEIIEQASESHDLATLPQSVNSTNKQTGSARGTRKRKPGQSKTGKNPKKQKVNKETIWQNKMDEVLNQVLETANFAIRKINESSQEAITNRSVNPPVNTCNDQSKSSTTCTNQNDQNDQSMSNEIESHHDIFSDNEQQDLENDNEIDDFLSEMPKIFEDDEKFGEETNENISKMVQSIVKKKSDVKSIVKELKIPSNCKDLSPPAVNSEIWHFLDRNIKSKDLGLQTVQKLLGHGIVPIIRMAEELKSKSPDSKKLKKCISDSLTVLLNAFFEISVNRRLLMKPFIDKRYHQLCNRNEKIGDNKLFEDVGKRLKDINDAQKINRNYFSKNFRGSRGNRMMTNPQSSYSQRGRYRTGQFSYSTDQNKSFVRGARGRRNLRRSYYN